MKELASEWGLLPLYEWLMARTLGEVVGLIALAPLWMMPYPRGRAALKWGALTALTGGLVPVYLLWRTTYRWATAEPPDTRPKAVQDAYAAAGVNILDALSGPGARVVQGAVEVTVGKAKYRVGATFVHRRAADGWADEGCNLFKGHRAIISATARDMLEEARLKAEEEAAWEAAGGRPKAEAPAGGATRSDAKVVVVRHVTPPEDAAAATPDDPPPHPQPCNCSACILWRRRVRRYMPVEYGTVSCGCAKGRPCTFHEGRGEINVEGLKA